ncbi:MAG: hypothetical protein QW412_00865 [Candidatus Aenigmatarchaeota archaeon]
MSESLVQEMFQKAKKFVKMHSEKGASDVQINAILNKRPFTQGEFIINQVLRIGLKPFDLPGTEYLDYELRNLQQLTKEWKKYVEERRKKTLVPSTHMCGWYFGSTNLSRRISLRKIEEFAERYKLEYVFLTSNDGISHVCLNSEDLNLATLYKDGYWVGTTLELSEEEDAKLYERIGREIYRLKESVGFLRGKMNSIRRKLKEYQEGRKSGLEDKEETEYEEVLT